MVLRDLVTAEDGGGGADGADRSSTDEVTSLFSPAVSRRYGSRIAWDCVQQSLQGGRDGARGRCEARESSRPPASTIRASTTEPRPPMKKLAAAIALMLVGCGGAVAPSPAPTASPSVTLTASPSPSPSRTVDPFIAACQAAKSGVRQVTTEAHLMLKSYAATLQDPTNQAAEEALTNHMTATHNWSNWTLRDLSSGDSRLNGVKDGLRTIRDLVTTRDWTSKQVSMASIELIDAAGSLGDC
jgi:hypothetical protein